jgi:hypothetical protein
MTMLCIAAMLSTIAQHHLTAHAFVPQQTIITTHTKSSFSPTTILFPPNKHTTPVTNNNNNLHHLLQSRNNNRYSIMISNMAASASSSTDSSTDEDLEKEIQSMKAKDIRQELESYGISTKSFFEKSELVEALVKARKEGKTPTIVNGDDSSGSTSSATTTADAASSSSSTINRQERLNQEMEKCKSMKVGELKKELESYGVSTKSYFEKSEFVRAVAEARVDGVAKSTTTTTTTAGSSSSSSSRGKEEEPMDPSYRDVIVSKFRGDKALLGRGVIDVKAR